ncbi:MAG: OprD family outer membrane porin, partial [Sulfurimonadaceae bacterium]
MKKTLVLSLASIVAITGLQAAEDLSSMFTEGETSGQIRMFYIDRQYQGGSGADTHRNSLALGGHLKYETAAWNGLSVGAAFYTTNGMHGLDYNVVDPSLLGTGLKSYSILGEAYANIDLSDFGTKTNAKLGYQRFDVPMMGSDDARMLPNTFEAYKFTNNDIENVNFQIAHVDRIAYGTFSNIYNGLTGSSILASTAGYPSQRGVGTGEYLNMGKAAVGKETDGVTNALVSFNNKSFRAKISNDYAWDLYNTLYADAG